MKNEQIQYNFDINEFLIIAIGRLTKQKNFKFLVNCFDEILMIKKNAKLLIIGEGEEKKILQNLIQKKNLSKKIILLDFQDNIFNYLKTANLFVLASLWEDPGWVLIEAATCDTLILSSNCKNGPEEFIENNKGGILFENNSSLDFIKKFKEINNLDNEKKIKKKLFAKKKVNQYTIFRHFRVLNKILD